MTLLPSPNGPAIYVGSAPSDAGSRHSATASNNHRLYAISLPEGTALWRAEIPNPVQTTPLYGRHDDEDRLYVATGQPSLHGKESVLHALDPADGKRVWDFDTDDRRFLYPLAADENIVYVGRRDDQLGQSGEYVYALGAPDGTEQWRVESGDVARSSGRLLRNTFFLKVHNQLSALSPQDGSERWRLTGNDVLSGPTFGSRGKRLFIESGGVVRALRLGDGEELWRRDFDFTVSRVTTPREGMSSTVYVGDYDGRLLALSPLDGSTRWTMAVNRGQFTPSVERTSETLFVGGAGVHALDPVSGERKWAFTPDVEGYVGAHAGTTVFANAGREGSLWALDPETGETRWHYQPGGRVVGPATAGDHTVVGVDGAVYALDGSQKYASEQQHTSSSTD